MGQPFSVALLVGVATSCVADPSPPPDPPRFHAEAWPEADQLFRGDPFWVGADGAYSIDLGLERTLWLFGDTYIDVTGEGSRRSPGVKMIGNSIGLQQGRDPSNAAIEFAWWRGVDGNPSAFFPDVADERYWPGNGIRIGSSVIVFLMRVRRVSTGLGFEVTDWDAVLITNPDDAPPNWQIRPLATGQDERGIIVGSAGILLEGEWLYVYGSKEPGAKSMYLARFSVERARVGDLQGLEWWTRENGFVVDSPTVEPSVVMTEGQSEWTVHRDVRSGRLLQFQTVGFGGADVGMRDALVPEGPWFRPQVIYRPEERERVGVLLYQGKAHPQLAGADVVLTYCSNHLDFATAVNDESLYFPRFIRLSREESTTRRPLGSALVD
jgi:Domain of unknown function (DUF4185)